MYKHFSIEERILIEYFLNKKYSLRKIANELKVNVSSISREIKRNKVHGIYKYKQANKESIKRRINSKRKYRIIENNEQLKKKIIKYLKKFYSPEQISYTLKLKENISITHTSIYKYLKQNCCKNKIYLRGKKKRRVYGTKRIKKALKEVGIKRINQRSNIIEQRKRIGDFEGDTVLLSNRKDRLLTLVDRKSGYLILEKLIPNKLFQLFNLVVKEVLKHKRKIKTITFDNGSEFAQHKLIEEKSNILIYFAYPYSSYQRGTNENTNGLIRQFFPKRKKDDILGINNIKKVQYLLNHRPRKRLNFLTPHEVFVEGKKPEDVLHLKV